MKKQSVFLFLLSFALPAFAQNLVNITVKMAPMPYYNQTTGQNADTVTEWLQNALGAAESGTNSFDNGGSDTQANDPAAYQTAPSVITNPGMFITSSTFNSWMGEVNPPSPFNAQLGLEWAIIINITSSGQLFNLWDLDVRLSSSDPGDLFGANLNMNGSTISIHMQ